MTNKINATQPTNALVQVLSCFAARENATVEDVVALAKQLKAVLGDAANKDVPRSLVSTADLSTQIAVPAVPLDQSVTDEAVTCLCCGKSFTMLKRHLKAEHGLTEEQYRVRFDLPEDHPLVAPNYSIRKAEYAKRIGLGKYTRDDVATQNSLPSA
ncbi:MucR family transcriptional regulator [Sulfitobacter sediminilitoris]|uniref:MucR family transcriptional regulator n=1 Tax=Sulfitobacter sediminilitoris TaxID=2698830 RepID=UPI002E293F9F|nr:MucR family transcriptional regulator [Sulfitobacter sediminilitoris]